MKQESLIMDMNSTQTSKNPPEDNVDGQVCRTIKKTWIDSLKDKFAKQKHAMDFLYKVRVQYSNNPTVYNQFLEIMKDFKSGR